MSHSVWVETVRQHLTADGMRTPGVRYERSKISAARLEAMGTVQIVDGPTPVVEPEPSPPAVKPARPATK